MSDEDIVVKLTNHAKIKIDQRNITLNTIKKIVVSPEIVETDRFERSLTHFIGNIEGRILRVTRKVG